MSNQNYEEQPLSKCCEAPLMTSAGDEGTMCYICRKCNKPSDPKQKKCECENGIHCYKHFKKEMENRHETSNVTITPTDSRCPCACHENLLNKSYEHDIKCCENMNGVVVTHTESTKECEHGNKGNCLACYNKTISSPTESIKDKNGHLINSKGNLIFDKECRGCDAPSPTKPDTVYSTFEDETRGELYRLMDTFIVEAKDQDGNERSLDRLNKDRHLFIENLQDVIRQEKEKSYQEGHERGYDIAEDMWKKTAEEARHSAYGEIIEMVESGIKSIEGLKIKGHDNFAFRGGIAVFEDLLSKLKEKLSQK